MNNNNLTDSMQTASPAPPAGPAWYCIYTKRYKEQFASLRLREVCEEVYLPLLRHRRLVRKRPQWVTEPLFPGYLFARFCLEQRLEKVRYTPGVARLIASQTGTPQEVDGRIITGLRQRSPHGYIEIQPEPLVMGETVEVITGPFQKLHALFQRELKTGERVVVLLELLSSQVVVELPREYIQKTSQPTLRA